MNALLVNVLTVGPHHQSPKEIIRWWEQRRVFYNGLLLPAGLITIALAVLLGEIAFTDVVNTLPPVLFVAFSANLFYTMGWIIEIVCLKLMPKKEFVKNTGLALFIAVITLSAFFTFAIDIALFIAFLRGN